MMGRQVSPRAVAVVTIVLLGIIQFAYWRLLVYREPGPPPRGGGGGPIPTAPPTVVGRTDVTVETLAGSEPGFQDGATWQARFCGPNALALAPDGALLVSDSRNHRIRRIGPDGQVTTLVGASEPDGPGGSSLGPAESTQLCYPSGVAVAPDNSILISDTGNHRILRLQSGQVTLVAEGGAGKPLRSPGPIAVGPVGEIWVRQADGSVRQVSSNGLVVAPSSVPPSVRAALGEAGEPIGAVMTASPDGNGVAEPTSFRIGTRGPAVGSGEIRIVPDVTHHVLLAENTGGSLLLAGRRTEKVSILGMDDGTGARASFAGPCAALVAPGGLAYVADYEGHRIRRVRLPQWLVDGGAAPVTGSRVNRNMRRRFGRNDRGG